MYVTKKTAQHDMVCEHTLQLDSCDYEIFPFAICGHASAYDSVCVNKEPEPRPSCIDLEFIKCVGMSRSWSFTPLISLCASGTINCNGNPFYTYACPTSAILLLILYTV